MNGPYLLFFYDVCCRIIYIINFMSKKCNPPYIKLAITLNK